MADRIETPSITVPAGTAVAAAMTTQLPFPDGVVDGVEIVVPGGVAGLVGFQILHSGQAVIPRDSNQFIVTDGEVIKWPLSNFPTGGKWAARCYNTDQFDHTLYFRFLINEFGPKDTSIVTPVSIVSSADRAALGG
jgi:hypothetical protein